MQEMVYPSSDKGGDKTFMVTVKYRVKASDEKGAMTRLAKYETDVVYYKVQRLAKEKQLSNLEVESLDCDIILIEDK